MRQMNVLALTALGLFLVGCSGGNDTSERAADGPAASGANKVTFSVPGMT